MIWGSEKFHMGLSLCLQISCIWYFPHCLFSLVGFSMSVQWRPTRRSCHNASSLLHKHGPLISVGLASIWCNLPSFHILFKKIPYVVNISFLSSPFFFINKFYQKRIYSSDCPLLPSTLRIRNKFPESFIILQINSEISIPPLSNLGE